MSCRRSSHLGSRRGSDTLHETGSWSAGVAAAAAAVSLLLAPIQPKKKETWIESKEKGKSKGKGRKKKKRKRKKKSEQQISSTRVSGCPRRRPLPCVSSSYLFSPSFSLISADATREHFQLAAFRFGGWLSPGFNQPITHSTVYLLLAPNSACRTAARNKSI